MIRVDRLRGPLLAGLLWSVFALAEVGLRSLGGAEVLIWIPSAIAVAALYATPVPRWPVVLGVLFMAELLTWMVVGAGAFAAIGFAVANCTEALICAGLGVRVLGGRGRSPQSFTDISFLFAIAIVGCAAGTAIALPFSQGGGADEALQWFLSSVLGVLAGAPTMLYLRQWLGFGDQNVRFWCKDRNRGFMLTMTGLLIAGTLVFALQLAALLPLLFVAIVFAVIRYGQMAAACGVIAYAAAATLASFGGDSPAAFLSPDSDTAGLILRSLMLLMLATALPIASMLMTRDRLEAQLRAQNAEMRENLTILKLAESLAGIGRWRYDLRSGAQQWSPLMLELNGLPRELAPDPGNIRNLLPDGGAELFGAISAHRDTREPYSFDYRVQPPEGGVRNLKIHITNEYDEQGERIGLFAVAMEVTEQVRREEALHQARQRAIGLAAEAQKLANTDQLTGLANRRCTFDWLERLIRASSEVGEPLAALIFDIDHFKRINDAYGHHAGDEVLRQVSRLARSVLRTEDLVGRIGGEEFVCILPGVSGQEARGLAERLCRAVADGIQAGGLPRTTISVGLAVCHPGDTPERLIARADAALYEAKDAGRNRVRRAA